MLDIVYVFQIDEITGCFPSPKPDKIFEAVKRLRTVDSLSLTFFERKKETNTIITRRRNSKNGWYKTCTQKKICSFFTIR